MDKTVKNVLAAVGAVAVVKTAPVLALGAAVGAVASNPEKVKKTVNEAKKTANDLVGRAKANFAKYGVDVFAEEECECCNGGVCTCEGECACDSAGEPEQERECVSTPMEESEQESCEDWEEEVPAEEETPVAEEPASKPTPTEADKLENLRSKGMEFFAALKELAEDALK